VCPPSGENWAVFRIERGRARLTPVIVGEGGERYRAITSGLNDGDRVILFPGDALEDGARVAPRRE
jgi:HlyD family secretion protein